MDSCNEIEDLISQINYHNDLYYNQSCTEISDTEFDELVECLKKLILELEKSDPNHYLVIAGKEIVDIIGSSFDHEGETIKFNKTAKMGSLAKIYTIENLMNWANNIGINKFAMFPKIDGVSVVVEYHNGKLKLAALTGSGDEGINRFKHFEMLDSIPNEIKYTGNVYLRGEMYMKKSVLKELSDTGVGTFANCRNATSGALLCDDPVQTAQRKLDFFVYNVELDNYEFSTEEEKVIWMKNNLIELNYVPIQLVDCNFDSVKNVVDEWENKIRSTLDYNIDGLVWCANEIEIQENAGWNKRIPCGKKAFKFKAERKETKALDFVWSAGMSGYITPVLEIEPTYIDGSTVHRITLHNYGFIKDKNVEIGDTILFEKAGDIIPYFIRVVNRNGRDENSQINKENIKFPEFCPSCGYPTKIDGVHLVCENDMCNAKLEQQIEAYLYRCGIKGIGIAVIRTLMKNGIVTDIPSLYEMDKNKIAKLSGYGTKSADNIVDPIMKNRNVDLWRFICMMGIIGVGSSVAKKLANKFRTLDGIINASEKEMMTINGFGPSIIKSVKSGLEKRLVMIEKLLKYITINDFVEPKQGILSGKSFCVTGKMPSGVDRKVIHNIIEENGGIVKSGVVSGLDYLIAGEKAGSKLSKAEKLNVNVLTEDDFMSIINK